MTLQFICILASLNAQFATIVFCLFYFDEHKQRDLVIVREMPEKFFKSFLNIFDLEKKFQKMLPKKFVKFPIEKISYKNKKNFENFPIEKNNFEKFLLKPNF